MGSDNAAFCFLPTGPHHPYEKRLRVVISRFAERGSVTLVASVVTNEEENPRVLLNGAACSDGPEWALRSLLYVSADSVKAEMVKLGKAVENKAEPPPYSTAGAK